MTGEATWLHFTGALGQGVLDTFALIIFLGTDETKVVMEAREDKSNKPYLLDSFCHRNNSLQEAFSSVPSESLATPHSLVKSHQWKH